MSEVLDPPETISADAIRGRSEELATDAFYQWTDDVDEWLVQHAFEHWPDAVASVVRASVKLEPREGLNADDALCDAYVSDALQRGTYWDAAVISLDDDRSDQ